MPAIQTITCANCGAKRRTNMKNTRYCRLCRFILDLGYWTPSKPTRTCKAEDCKATFLPTARNDRFCAEHGILTVTKAECLYCKQPGFMIHEEVQVCTGCAKNPAMRARLLAALIEKIDRQREENPAPEPQTLPPTRPEFAEEVIV